MSFLHNYITHLVVVQVTSQKISNHNVIIHYNIIKMSLTFGSSNKCVGSDIILLDDSWIGLWEVVEYLDGLS